MMTVKELMSSELCVLKATDTIHEARELMLKKHIRHIPIIDESGVFVGLLTKHDVLAISISTLAEIDKKERDEIDANIPIGQVMNTDIMVADEHTSLIDAAQFVLNQKHGCIPILRGNKLVGILTESDFVRLAIILMEEEL